MNRWTRRSFLAGCAATAATPASSAPRQSSSAESSRSGHVDFIIVGAGAAGIAAARRFAAAGKRLVLVEAAAEMGGRCITDSKTFSVPYDRGAHWIYSADVNPIAKLALPAGLALYPAPPGRRMRIGRRYAREGEMEDFLATMVRVNSAIADAARKNDVACAQALPKDLGEWRPTIEFTLGPYACGKDLSEISALDVARSIERDNAVFCRQGLGTLLAKLAPAGTVQLATPVTRIGWSRSGVDVETDKGQFRGNAAIVTVSTNVLTSGKIKHDLPKRHLDAAGKLRLGERDRVAFELNGNVLGLRADELVFEKSENKETAALFANMAGSTVCAIDVGGSFGRDLSNRGEDQLIDFAIGWLTRLYGGDIKKSVRRQAVTRWGQEPWVMGSISAAAPGAQAARKILMEPISNRIFYAGEAAHETLWGTVAGAWESGERAADAALKVFGRG